MVVVVGCELKLQAARAQIHSRLRAKRKKRRPKPIRTDDFPTGARPLRQVAMKNKRRNMCLSERCFPGPVILNPGGLTEQLLVVP